MSLNKTFDSESVIQFFKKAIERNKLSSAYLFTGEASSDKKNTAIELARLINCQRYRSVQCSCLNCQKIESFEHPDVIWIEALGDPPSVKIGQIRDLRRKIVLKPYEADKKVFIIDQAEKMTEEAQNALLKTLEEPPSDSILILISLNTQELLETIISRCKIIKFERQEDLSSQLQRYEIIDNFLLTEKQNIEQLFDCQTKEQFLAILKTLLSLYRDVLILKSKADKSLLLNQDRKDKIYALIDSYTYEELYKIITFLNRMYRYVSFNLNLKTCIINTIMGLKEIMKVEVL